MSRAPRPAPSTYSASAPRLASLSTCTGRPSALARARRPRSSPTQPGRIDGADAVRSSGRSGRPAPTPAPSTRVAVDPGLARAPRSTSSRGRVQAAGWRRGRRRSPGRPRRGSSATGRRRPRARSCGRTGSRARCRPRDRATAARAGGRWAPAAAARRCSCRGTAARRSGPLRCSSPTRLETVERARPVSRAIVGAAHRAALAHDLEHAQAG